MDQEKSYDFSATLEISTNKLWGAHFAVPQWITTALLEDSEDRRVICLLNGSLEYQCAMLHRGDGSYLITVNKKIRDKFKLKEGSLLQVSLRKDHSEYGLPMPEELEELLAQDEEGKRFFAALTPGKIRTLLYIVGQPKTSDTRLKRALAIVEHLKQHAGKINYRQLNEDMKKMNLP